MPRNTTEKERKEVIGKTAAREVKQPYSTEIEDREAEKAQKEKPAPPPNAKRDEGHHGQ
jgi:hypothetical protein